MGPPLKTESYTIPDEINGSNHKYNQVFDGSAQETKLLPPWRRKNVHVEIQQC